MKIASRIRFPLPSASTSLMKHPRPITLALFDLDGTLTQERSAWEYLHRRLGLWDGHAERFQEAFLRGQIDYDRFCQLDAALWKGMKTDEILSLLKEIPLQEGIRDLMTYLKSKGIKTAIISSGLSLLADWIKEQYGFDEAVANVLETKNGKLTGDIQIHVHHDRKGEWVERIRQKFGARQKEILAIGDSAGDLGMFQKAGFSIAFNSRCQELESLATWSIRSRDLRHVITCLMPFLEPGALGS